EREDFGTTYHAALKTITIPKNQAELDSILDDGMDATSAESYLQQFVEKIVSEFVLMSKLKGNSHIVSYEDHQVIKHKDGIGWDILIRMELLTPMMSYMKTTSITKRDVIKLGIDMCRALELCQKYNIIHRDIKPENIFISDSGDFKLGDFGIAKEVEKTQSGLTKTGTQTYMAPEVYKGQPYGSSVDLYSLGVVLYRLLNHNRAPFMPQYPEPISYSAREKALIMRMGGHQFPEPSGVEEGCRLAEIAMKACSFNPEDRYSSPTQMREDLEAIMYSEGEGVLMFPSGDAIDIKSVNYVSNSKNPDRTEHLRDEQTEVMGFDDATEVMEDVRTKFNTSSKTGKTKTKKLSKIIIPAVATVILAVAGALFIMNNKNVSPSIAVSSVSELTEPIEFKVNENITEADYEKIISRLEAYGVEYYANKDEQVFAVEKNDLGATNQEILATLHMITGKGEVKIDSLQGSDDALTRADVEKCEYVISEEEYCSYMNIYINDAGKEKLNKIQSEITDGGQNDLLCLYVDGNQRYNDAVFDGEKIVVEGGYDGKQFSANNSFIMNTHAEQAHGTIDLSPNYIRLLVFIVNDGELTKSYEVFVDEKYGIAIPEEVKEPEITEEPKKTEEPLVEEKNEPTKPSSSTKKPTTQTKPSGQTQQQSQPQAEQPQVQQPEIQQPQVEQPQVQQPEIQQPAAEVPTTPPVNNPAGMPEIYIDFD
ncbi:MAG: serine/threonine protein kinase, partial [Clostridia bacterium]|nr:serine/threonine protein kinase [Clostridia bacterium]